MPARIALKRKTTQAKLLVPLDVSRGFAHTSTILLRWFFIIRVSFHVAYETFLLTQLFETPYHLLYRFARPRFNFQHIDNTFPSASNARSSLKTTLPSIISSKFFWAITLKQNPVIFKPKKTSRRFFAEKCGLSPVRCGLFPLKSEKKTHFCEFLSKMAVCSIIRF